MPSALKTRIVNGKTVGVKPAVPATAIVTVLAFVLSYFAISLPPEVSLALAVLLGGGAGVASGPGEVESRR